MRLITITNLYPDPDSPRHGIFIRERLEQLVASGEVRADVVALRPGAGGRGTFDYAREGTTADGISVTYRAVPSLPKISNWIDPLLWAAAAVDPVRTALDRDDADVVLDGHFLYPDGVAVALLGRRLGVPVVLSARGSDVNVKCRNLVMRQWVRWAARNCDAVITVSQALADALAKFGIHPRRTEVIPNGVDLQKFTRRNRDACRERYGVSGNVVVTVGHLIPEKGHAIAIDALPSLPDVTLLLAGEGPGRHALERQARLLGVEDRVRFLGLIAHKDMPDIYSAADALLLPSAMEGMPNVILECIACGTRVVATDVGGIGEVITSPAAGVLMEERSAQALANALNALWSRPVTPAETRAHAGNFAWGPQIRRQLDLYRGVLASRTNRSGVARTN